MRIILTFVLALGLATGGCAWFNGGSEAPEKTAPPQEQPAAPAVPEQPAPPAEKGKTGKKADKKAEKAADKKPAGKSSGKSVKTEEEIRVELDMVGRKLVGQASRTVVPSKASKEVRQAGGEHVASYVEVDAQSMATELRPGAQGQYVGFIRYQEKVFECRGASRQAALAADCQQVKARRINELIRYDGHTWQY